MIEELLLALNGLSGDLFYPAAPGQLSLSNCGDAFGGGWVVAPELTDVLHPGEEHIVSTLLSLSAYVKDIDDFTQIYGSCSLFQHTMASIVDKTKVIPSSAAAAAAAAVPDRISGYKDISCVEGGVLASSLLGTYAASLCEGLSSILRGYKSHLVALEKELCNWNDDDDETDFKRPAGALSLIYAELQPFCRIMPVIGKFLKRLVVSNGANGQIIASLCGTYESHRADHVVENELRSLLRHCLTPFRNHLMLWLSTGRVESDIFGEFFIQMKNDRRSEQFTIRKDALPPFITDSTAGKIVFIGESMKLMLDSSSKPSLDDWEEKLKPLHSFLLSYSIPEDNDDSSSADFGYDRLMVGIEKQIEHIRRATAEKLYVFTVEDTDAKKALEAWVKNTFFLGKGDLFLAFVDLGESSLSEPFSRDQADRQTKLLAKRWAQALEKIYWQHDDEKRYFSMITPCFASDSTKDGEQQITYWDAVRIQLEAPQRLAPIFTPQFIANLNRIFRFLLRWRRTQALIEACWVVLKKSPVGVTKSLPNLEKINQLVSLVNFVVKNFQYYIQADVLETFYAGAMEEIVRHRDYERVLRALHVDLIDRVRVHCFLKKREGSTPTTTERDEWQAKVGRILKGLGDECDEFSQMILARIYALGDTKNMDDRSTSATDTDDAFAARVHDFYVKFHRRMALLFKILTSSKVHEDSTFLNRLLLRLDFNGYFSNTQIFNA